jgi:MSHA biogenesis protein MshG
MAIFNYVGRSVSGSLVKGTIEAASDIAVAEQLSQQNITPVLIKNAQATKNSSSIGSKDIKEILGIASVSLDDLIVFCRQMYALMKSGVPILRAIHGLSESSNAPALKTALADVASQLEGGFSLSSAMHKHANIFPPLAIALVHVGENTGQLDAAFLKLASYFEKEQETRKRIKTALRYPSFVLIALVLAIIILNIKVIPVFASMFSKLGADLPWATQLLIASSDFFLQYWPHMLVAVLFVFFALRQYLATEAGRYRWDRRKTKLPIIGSIIERSILSRFSHSFAIVLRSGVPMTTGLSLVADAVDNTYMKDKINGMRSGIESGESLLRTAISSQLFTSLVLQMIAVGEETGRVDDLLDEVAEYYEREVDYELATLTARIEPILILIVAAMVLVLALGIFTPMWDMMSAYKGK